MKKIILILTILSFFFFVPSVWAQKNNKFGIHIISPQEVDKAAELVNSNGGDWGYLTIVIQDDDRNFDKWQNFFDLCREKHLIPLVRIATHLKGEVWEKPTQETLIQMANFLNLLNWPVKTRYIIIFNEPNHAKEWGGEVNPKEYAQILDKAITIFKEKNPNFFLLNAGFDQAAPNSKLTMDEAKFLKEINLEVPGIFSRLDGWASHSYPNHGFIGKPWESGRATVKGYEWELSFLKNLGSEKNLPVFITETGWPHEQNPKSKNQNPKFYDQKTVANFIKQTFENVWLKDERVEAVTPFILNYPFPPFESFSWLDRDGNPYPQFEEIKNLSKIKGEPEQEENYEVVEFSLPPLLPTNFQFKGKITLKNTGQSTWGEKKFRLKGKAENLKLSDLVLPEGKLVKPKEIWTFEYTLETLSDIGEFNFSWEGFLQRKIRVFSPWLPAKKKTSFLNRLLQGIFDFWYN